MREHGLDMISELDIQGIPISELVGTYGTPLFVYDAQILHNQYERLSTALHPALNIFYSLKANPNIAISALLRSLGAGAEVSSHTELIAAQLAGFAPSDTIFVGPGKSAHELDACLRHDLYATVCESIQELTELDELARYNDKVAPVAVRVNPRFAAHGARLSMAGKPRQFGIDEEHLITDTFAGRFPNLHIRGVHVYMGTRILSPKTIADNTTLIFDLAELIAETSQLPLEFIDVGGGIGVAYFDGEHDVNLDDLTRFLNPVIERFATAHPDTRLVTELGRYLTAPAGIYVTTVRYTKKSKGENFAITDGGTNHHLAAVGIGSVFTRDFPVQVLNRNAETATAPWTITGPLCTPTDTLANRTHLPPLRQGDLIGILRSGAYGPSASPGLFLGHGYPAEILIHRGRPHLIRARDRTEDILRAQHLPEFLRPNSTGYAP